MLAFPQSSKRKRGPLETHGGAAMPTGLPGKRAGAHRCAARAAREQAVPAARRPTSTRWRTSRPRRRRTRPAPRRCPRPSLPRRAPARNPQQRRPRHWLTPWSAAKRSARRSTSRAGTCPASIAARASAIARSFHWPSKTSSLILTPRKRKYCALRTSIRNGASAATSN